ncbi:hypothetical protein CU098_008904 [Rhizopus stolonifer]|uniref:Endonuclease/exonuclease/phosphatase domain-containing protein n=1 Tax=Rhizopus stolonifer TaxID=4846 RepID=A0A367JCX7_RHIST|nr:hypothetical protein CU098_008904 [Rhizopus stolonifer]
MPTNTNDNIPSFTNHHVKFSDFIHYLRQLNYDILCLQETHAATFEQQHTFNIRFTTENTIWAKHCGIVSLNIAITLIPHLITLDQRLIAYQVTHTNSINIYAPANEIQRKTFYKDILQFPLFLPYSSNPMNNEHIPCPPITEFPPMIILGDSNYHITQHASTNINPITNTAISSQQ